MVGANDGLQQGNVRISEPRDPALRFSSRAVLLRQRDACTLVLAVEAREDPNTQDTAGRLVAATVHLLQHTMTTSPTTSGSSDNSGRNMVRNLTSATSAVCS